MAPPTAPTNNRGNVSKKAMTPIATGEFETCHTSQLCATFCMKSPELEISAPSNSRRKFRCLRERSVRRSRRFGMFGLTKELVFLILRDRVQLSKPSKGLAIVRELSTLLPFKRPRELGKNETARCPSLNHC